MNDLLIVRKKVCGLHRFMLKTIEELEELRKNEHQNSDAISEKEMKLEYAVLYLSNQILNRRFWTDSTPFDIQILGDEDYCMLDASYFWDRHHR